jgi:ribosomal protein S18 acetylase RimI-like enzyme
MSSVVVRAGRAEDFDTAVAVYRLANDARRGGQPVPPESEERVRGYLGKPDAFLVIVEDGAIVVGMGLAMQGLADDGAGPPIPGVCFISMVYVAPDRWGEGIGGRIVDALIAEARSRGYDRTRLWTHEDNPRAQQLYEGRGFRRSGREKENDLGDHIVLYEREI